MKKLDRYIIEQFLVNFVILLAVMACLFVTVDLLVDVDEFLEAGRIRADQYGGVFAATLWTIGDYYGPTLVLMYVFFCGLLVVGAMGFTFTGLARNGELVAMVSSGVSMHRIAAPVLVIGLLLNGLAIPNQELLIPRLSHKLARSKSQVKYDTAAAFDIHYAVDTHGHLLSAAQFNAGGAGGAQPMLTGVTILERDAAGQVQRRITAEQAFWDEAKQGWELLGSSVIRPGEGAAGITAYHESPDAAVGFFATNLSPPVLLARRATIYPRLMSLGELQALTANPAVDAGPITQIMHSRFSMLVVNMLVLAMGLPFFLLREPANMLSQGVKASAVCLGAWGLGLVMLQVGVGQLNPVASAWLPVVVYLPVTSVMLQTIKT